jgi:hypothetical protein
MRQHTPTTETESTVEQDSANENGRVYRSLQTGLDTVLVVGFVLVAFNTPVAAQTNTTAICQQSGLENAINGFLSLTTGVGLIGALGMYKFNVLVEILAMNPEQKKQLKRKKNDIKKGVILLVGSGPLFGLAGSLMGLPIASCVNTGI